MVLLPSSSSNYPQRLRSPVVDALESYVPSRARTLPIMTSVRQVADLAGNEASACPWHAQTLPEPSGNDKAKRTGSKSSASHIVIVNIIHNQFCLNHLLRSDPMSNCCSFDLFFPTRNQFKISSRFACNVRATCIIGLIQLRSARHVQNSRNRPAPGNTQNAPSDNPR